MHKFLTAAFLFLAVNAGAQQPAGALTNSDYERAASFLSWGTAPYIDHAGINPVWISSDRFWFRDLTAQGSDFIMVDAAKGTKAPAFDQAKLAAALSAAAGKEYAAASLPFQHFDYTDNGNAILFYANGKSWKCDLKTYTCSPAAQQTSPAMNRRFGRGRRLEVLSPDGRLAAFIRDHNLWVRNTADNRETQLTTDGIADFGYATDNAGWKHSDAPILQWSPDSKKIATFQQDQRHVSNMYLVTTRVGEPELRQWKYPLPGDSVIIMIHRVIINVDKPEVIRLDIPADPHRATLSDDIASSGTFDDVEWSPDSRELAFVSTSRDHKIEKVRIADAVTGKVREVFGETVATQFESGWGSINWRYLPASHEFIWFSERDNWGHLYLYDSRTGQVKNQITKGDWLVSELVKVDEKKRTLYFMAYGRQAANPYFAQFCKIDFDGKNFKVLTPETGNHRIDFSPDENYFTDTYSQPDVPPVTVLRRLDGRLVTTVATADVSRLAARGWKAPAPVKLLAADGKTDIYGLVFTPTRVEAGKKYPVVDYIYPGPQGGSVGSWSFAASRGDHQALAELGFIVVVIEGTSNPLRSKSFHDMSYGNMAINTIPDQIAAIRQLAGRFPMDTNRVGIWGHSGGGFATATAMFRYPDFFKVGISESGNHDNRNYEDDWGERYNGLTAHSDYEAQANQVYAKNLKGKLLLVHGLMDDNVPPQNTLLVVEALQKANKDFDLILFPNSAHGYGPYSTYMMRRRWDYFVTNLAGMQPPHEYLISIKGDPRNATD